MAKPQHQTREHRAQRKYWTPIVAAGKAWCSEVICLEERDGRTRWIAPGSAWHVCHDTTGTRYLGPGHARCNDSEGARRGNAMRAKPKRRRVL